uniref:Uncharacterized protein n=1 Tax=Setaria viridis TaxID=4556 RepID=A0A4U6U657_SETVI|nr:hypothetical protein SEVIR_6G215700v2 [Setaria viridis]
MAELSRRRCAPRGVGRGGARRARPWPTSAATSPRPWKKPFFAHNPTADGTHSTRASGGVGVRRRRRGRVAARRAAGVLGAAGIGKGGSGRRAGSGGGQRGGWPGRAVSWCRSGREWRRELPAGWERQAGG